MDPDYPSLKLPALKRKGIAGFNEFSTQPRVLEAFDQMRAHCASQEKPPK